MANTLIEPDDVDMWAGDPAFVPVVQVRPSYVVVCSCGWTEAHVNPEAADYSCRHHHQFAHPAHRNPELTCHSVYLGNDGWCLRPKNHEGQHWTPSFLGGTWWGNADV